MDRHLTRRELNNTKNFIKLDIGRKIVPAKVMPISNYGGYYLFFWGKELFDSRFKNIDSIGVLYPEIYPVEDIGPRLRLKKQISNLFYPQNVPVSVERDISLVVDKDKKYRISPMGSGIFVPVYSSDEAYHTLAEKLMQEELEL